MSKDTAPIRSSGRTPLFGRIEPIFPLSSDFGGVFDGLFDSIFDLSPSRRQATEAFRPVLNVLEDESSITVHLEVPGMSEEELDLTLNEGLLTVKGEKQKDYDEERGKVHFVGRSYGSFEQRIPIRAEIDEDAVEASVKNGVLSVMLPKVAKGTEKAKKISVRAD